MKLTKKQLNRKGAESAKEKQYVAGGKRMPNWRESLICFFAPLRLCGYEPRFIG